MYDNDNDNNNNCKSIIVDTNTKSKTSKIYCVICYDKVQLDCIDHQNYIWRCGRCKNTYTLFGYGSPDLAKEDDELVSSHEPSDEGPIIMTAEDNRDSRSILDRENKTKSDIKIPKYMQDSETATVTYREY